MSVLESFRPNPSTNPYLLLLTRALADRAEVDTFSWRRGVFGRYDVFHVHWPEVLVRGRTVPRSLVRTVAFVAVLVASRLRGRAIVRTLHNLAPHERLDPARRAVLALCNRWTTEWITLTETTASPDRQPSTTIPHGHYRGWYPDAPADDRIAGRVLFFGLVRRYKGVEDLLAAFERIDRPDLTLRIVGRLDDPELGDLIRAAASADDRVTASLEYLDEKALAAEIAACQLVVLPYRNMVNSGSLLLALSLARPVLAPRSPSTEELEEEIGPDWLLLYDDELSERVLSEALVRTSDLAGSVPDLSAREWDLIASAHIEVFERAVLGGAQG